MSDFDRAEESRERNEGLVYVDYHDRMERFRHEAEEDPDSYWTPEDEEAEDDE